MIENAQEEHDVELFGQQIRKLIDRRLDELNLRAERGSQLREAEPSGRKDVGRYYAGRPTLFGQEGGGPICCANIKD